ncbi:MAG: hypothetical protein ACE5SV_08135, partial [Candidatus Nitrosomaritimum aestuariumsis]
KENRMYKHSYYWGQRSENYLKQAKQQKIEAERNLRYKHLKEDGKKLTNVAPNSGMNWKEYDRQKFYLKDARQIPDSRGNWKIQTAKENYLRGMYDFDTYQNVVSGGVKAVKDEQKAQAERSLAKSRARNRAEVIQDRQKWNDTANSFFETKKQNDSDFFNDVVETVPNYKKMTQKEYTKALREGKVNLATALLNQRTAGGYTGPNTVNIETFLTERGYDLSKPEEIPDSIFKPEKQLKARAQASKAVKNNSEMGDLRLLANTYKKRNFGPNQFFNTNTKIQTKKFKANDPLEFMGPTNPKKIENFKLMDNQPLNLSMASDMFGRNMKTGEIQRLKTVGETTSPEMQFFGQFIQGSRNTFDSYGNLLTNTGNFLTGKPQQPLARPPVQDEFFGAVIDSAKNTFQGPSEDRASDPMGEFFGTQQKRIDKQGFGQVAGELTTEALFWALPVGAVAKIPKIATSFFSPTVKATKASKAFTPGGDFMKLEGKTKDVTWGDQIGAFFGPKGSKTKSQPFTSSNIPLGKGTTKPKGSKKTDSNNFFGGSSGTGKKFKPDDNNFFKEMKGSGSNQFLIVKTKQIPKTKVKQLTKPKPVQQFFKPQVIPKQKLKLLPKTKLKQKQKQQFFKPIPLITPKLKQKQKPILKQDQQFFKPIPKLTPKLTPKLKEKKKYQQTGVIAPFFPPTAKSTGMFLPPLPFFRQGGRRNRLANRKRPAKKAFTAWNVNTKQVGSFLKGPTYKKSRSDYVFKDLDARTKRAKKEKDYDYLDFF